MVTVSPVTASHAADRPLDLGELLQALVRQQRITPTAAELALAHNGEAPHAHPLEVIAALGTSDLATPGQPLELEALCIWLADRLGLPYQRLDPLKLDPRLATKAMSAAFARHHQILVIAADDRSLTVACAQPGMRGWEADLAQTCHKTIRRVMANPVVLRRLIEEFFRLAQSVRGAYGPAGITGKPENFEQLVRLQGVEESASSYEAPVVQIVDWLFKYAFEQGASDVHIEPRREHGDIRLRIDGILRDAYQLPAQVTLAVISRLKSLGRMNVAEKRKPQDGRVKTQAPGGATIELRLATLPTAFGEKLVMRIFDPAVLRQGLEALGLDSEDLRRWRGLLARPHGIILVTGPTGSGKTTTLYASLHRVAKRGVNLCTIEDPIEMVEPAFNQMQVRPAIDLGFAEGVRALLRQDPDIIMIGEIRDTETATMAVQAALTGHLVLSTLHTNDAPGALTRLLELGVPGYLVKATLLGVMAQRLLRLLCDHCKVEQAFVPEDWQGLADAATGPLPKAGYKATGCELCGGSGYKGRAGIYELMVMNAALAAKIDSTPDLSTVRRLACENGMRTLGLAAARLVMAGRTSLAEALRVAPAQQD
ncbi:GspE/PulE family protein [Pseudomonas sp. RIT-PI-S]|uniref:GspE/PulE family protein n=1 Tax=Pseudomonas sp. RIT-PI-S TaxID=3035295 RepID=UPI0021DB732F|nr:GspE/PulE family protein [Pseudomonas sp. RIT-PI-S]